MATLDYLLTAGVALTAFGGLLFLLKKTLVSAMLIKTLIYALPVG